MFLCMTDAEHLFYFLFQRKRKVKLEIKIKRRRDGTREPSRCYTAFRYIRNLTFIASFFQPRRHLITVIDDRATL